MVLRSLFMIAALSVSSLSAMAAPVDVECQAALSLTQNTEDLLAITKEITPKCPNTVPRMSLCDSILSQTEDKDPESEFDYEFERRVYEMACVDIGKDSAEVAAKKVNEIWSKYPEVFYCDNSAFNVVRGNVLKFAATMSFTQFLTKAVKEWKVPLNTIDKSDGFTTLDYIRKEIARNKGTINEKSLKNYYDYLRKAGAKHKEEL